MNLLNRYLQAVARLLPSARRDDIIAELRANILSQFEERENDAGRGLTEHEQVEILRRFGNPAMIAGRYGEHNFGLAFGKQWIGPELFPFYRTVLLINLAISLIVLAGVIPLVSHAGGVAITLSRVLPPLLTQFVIVTGIFIMVERHKEQLFNSWDPRKLPAAKATPEDGPTGRNIFNFVLLAMGTLWLALTPNWPYLMLGPGALYLSPIPMRLMPQWTEFYWAILILLGAQLTVKFFHLFRWLPRQQSRFIDLGLKILGLGIAVLLLTQYPNYVVSANRPLAYWVNLSFLSCVIVALGINLWGTVRLLVSLRRERAQMAPAAQH